MQISTLNQKLFTGLKQENLTKIDGDGGDLSVVGDFKSDNV